MSHAWPRDSPSSVAMRPGFAERAAPARVRAELTPFSGLEARIARVGQPHLLHGKIDEARDRAVRHRVPVVRARRRGRHQYGFEVVASGRVDHRPAGAQIDVARPVVRRELRGREQLARDAVEHVEESVLRRLHDDLARAAIDLQVRENHRLRRGVVPLVAGRFLVMPDVFAGVGIHRDDRCEEQIVAAAGAAIRLHPRAAVADAEINEAQLRVVDDRVPHGAAAALLPPLAGQVFAAISIAAFSKPFAGSPGTV